MAEGKAEKKQEEKVVKPQPDLDTLGGISKARAVVYHELDSGKVSEAKALAQNRILEGQVFLKGTLPMRFMSIVAKSKDPEIQKRMASLVDSAIGFMVPALPEPKTD